MELGGGGGLARGEGAVVWWEGVTCALNPPPKKIKKCP